MTKEEWQSLRPGDVLRFYRKDGTYYLRTIMDCGEKVHGITIPIMRRSWTGRIHTTRFFSDCKHAEIHNRREDRLMTDAELMRLCECRFDIPKQLHREREKFGSLKKVPSSKLAGAAMVARAFCK